jgi:hypothetical protein
MAYRVVKTSQYFNWESIISFIIENCVLDPKGMKKLGFSMSSYLIVSLCSTSSFPTFNWAWTQNQSTIHIYCSQLWEANCKDNFYEIYDYFLSPLNKVIFVFFPHRISLGVIKSLRGIGD